MRPLGLLVGLNCIILNASFHIYAVTFILLKALRLPPRPSQTGSSFRAALGTMDLGGMILLMSTLAFLIVALNMSGQAMPWSSPAIIGMFCASAVSFFGFIVAENYAKLPIAPMRLFVRWKWRNVPLMLG